MKKCLFVLALMLSLPAVFVYSQQSNANSAETNTKFLQEFYDKDETSSTRPRNAAPPNPVWTAIKVLLYTGVFGAAAYFIVRFIISKGALPATEESELVELILTKPLGMGAYVQVIKVGNSYYLISLSSNGVKVMDKIEDKETIDFIELNKEKIKPKQTKFFDILSYLPLQKKTDKMDFLKIQKDRLKKM
jgi:flagellar biogenesis protein FliO